MTVKLIDDLDDPLDLPSPPTESPFGNPLVQMHGCEVIQLPKPEDSEFGDDAEDPLNEDLYFRAHRRFERQEKQLRNIERERAQHEKLQLDRILDELRGPDWLRTMGISGISDAEKRHYEPKRAFFIKELSALVEKFKVWKQEEKRRKLEREKFLLSRLEGASPESSGPQRPDIKVRDPESPIPDELPLSDMPSTPAESPDASDVDTWAALQLHQEAKTATAVAGKRPPKTTYSHKRRRQDAVDHQQQPESLPAPPSPPPPSPPPAAAAPPEPEKPFVSFYSTRSLRDTALSKRRKGRTRLAFGHAVPEMVEREFELPKDILTPEAIQVCRRKRRRMKRESRTD